MCGLDVLTDFLDHKVVSKYECQCFSAEIFPLHYEICSEEANTILFVLNIKILDRSPADSLSAPKILVAGWEVRVCVCYGSDEQEEGAYNHAIIPFPKGKSDSKFKIPWHSLFSCLTSSFLSYPSFHP